MATLATLATLKFSKVVYDIKLTLLNNPLLVLGQNLLPSRRRYDYKFVKFAVSDGRVLFFIVIDIYIYIMAICTKFSTQNGAVQIPLRMVLGTKTFINRLIGETTNIIYLWYNEITKRYAIKGLVALK